MEPADVPSPIDLCDPTDARKWAASAQSRPGRAETFAALHSQLSTLNGDALQALDLGSGPGFLAEYLLFRLPTLSLTLLDFSLAMHDLARVRLDGMARRATFVLRDFKIISWARDLGTFDAVITNQAVHELRHKQYAVTLHRDVASLLRLGGVYLVADHFCGEGGMANNQLYMSKDEHASALYSAGFRTVELVSCHGCLVMHRAA